VTNLLGARAVDRLAVRGARREMESRARARPAGSCRPAQGVECHSPGLGLLFVATTHVPAGDSVGLYLCVGWTEGALWVGDHTGSVLPTRGRHAAQVLSLAVAAVPVPSSCPRSWNWSGNLDKNF